MHPRQRNILIVALVLAAGYLWLRGGFVGLLDSGAPPPETALVLAPDEPTAPPGTAPEVAARLLTATVAAGCFWCVEADFDKVDGVVATISGYTGGRVAQPTYAQVSRGGTGHAEAVRVLYDPAVVSYEELLDHYWQNVDPFAANRQFCDVGSQYRPAIFYHSEEQRKAAEASKARIEERSRRPVVVEVVEVGPFYRAEEYHQDYYHAHPIQYRFYRWGCGRDARLAEIRQGAS